MRIRKRWAIPIAICTVLAGIGVGGRWYVSSPQYRARRLLKELTRDRPGPAGRLLIRLGWTTQPEERDREAILRDLRVIGTPAMRAAVRAYSEGLGGPDFLDVACAIGPPAVPAMVEALENHDPVVRWCAAYRLGCLGWIVSSVTIEGIEFSQLSEAEWEKAWHDAVALVTPALIRTLADPEMHVRCAAVETLGRLCPPSQEAVEALRKMIDSEDADLRRYVLESLGLFADDNDNPAVARMATDALHEARKSPHADVRTLAAEALETVHRDPTD